MKNVTKFFATFLFFALTVALLQAQNNMSTDGNSNTATALPPPSTSTNAAPMSNIVTAAGATPKKSSDNSPPVRIDNTGVHVGGAQPVDINWGNSSAWTGGSRLSVVLAPFVFSFVLPVMIIAIVFYFRHRRNKMVHETLRAMIEKGMPVNSELIAQLGNNNAAFRQQSPRSRRLLPGLILTGVGLALIGVHPSHAGTGGWIVLFMGIAFLIVWLVEKKDNNNINNPARPADKMPTSNDQLPKI